MTNHQNTITNNTKQAHVSTGHQSQQSNFSLCATQFGFSEPQMVRTVNHLVEDDEAIDSSEGKGAGGQKGNANRSKHSETEQRRRSKINERFQMLRDLIPENDQKRDKASLLLEVIEYIQYLQGKLQAYEGSCHGWSPESTKLTPRRANSRQFESFINQSHLEGRQLSGLEEDIVLNQTLISEVQNSVGSDFTGAALYKLTVNVPMPTSQCLPLNIPMQPPLFGSMLHDGSLLDAEQLNQSSQSHSGRSINDCYVPLFNGSEEELKGVNGEDTISSAYSQGLLDSLTSELRSSGVDMSQTNIAVQLDIGKQTNVGTADTVSAMKGLSIPSGLHSLKPGVVIGEKYDHPHKRFKTQQSWTQFSHPLCFW